MISLTLDSRSFSMHEPKEPIVSSARGGIPWAFYAPLIVLFITSLFWAAMGWGRNSTSIDNMTQALSGLREEINGLRSELEKTNSQYTQMNLAVSVKLQEFQSHFDRLEDHVNAIDARVNKLEGRH